eukprot:g4972.t1
MLDSKLKPWLIEVNISPSLMGNSPMDQRIKGTLFSDTLHLIGITDSKPKKTKSPLNKYKQNGKNGKKRGAGAGYAAVNALRNKTSSFHYRRNRSCKELLRTPIDNLCHEDVRMIMEFEDEASRRGHYRRIYPSPRWCNLLGKYFQVTRYNNLLLSRWMAHCQNLRQSGKGAMKKKKNEHVNDSLHENGKKLSVRVERNIDEDGCPIRSPTRSYSPALLRLQKTNKKKRFRDYPDPQ